MKATSGRSKFFLKLYPISNHQCWVVPSESSRPWMKENPHVFKCGPVTNANSFGWDVLIPNEVSVSWNGGSHWKDLIVTQGGHIAKSGFGHGVLTFHPGYTWHTPAGWSLMVGPLPNYDHGPFKPMSALIETDKLKYPFFPSVTLLGPGEFTFPALTPICRVFPLQISAAIRCTPQILKEPKTFAEYREWQTQERFKLKTSDSYVAASKARPYRSEKLGWKKFYRNLAEHPTIRMNKVKGAKSGI